MLKNLEIQKHLKCKNNVISKAKGNQYNSRKLQEDFVDK